MSKPNEYQQDRFAIKYGFRPQTASDSQLAAAMAAGPLSGGETKALSNIESNGAGAYYHPPKGGAEAGQQTPNTAPPAGVGSAGSGTSGKSPSTTTSLMDLIQEAGFTGSAAQTMYAIVMAESGGHVNAHNTNANTGDNSYGLAQINMLGSMGPERLKEYGLSSNDELFDPLTNLQVAYKLSDGGTNFSPWTTYTTGAYQQFLGQSGAKVSTEGTGGVAGGSNEAASDLSVFKLTDGLGNLLDQVPDLKSLVDQAVAHNWSSSTFQNAIENSAWWKTHSNDAREFIIEQANDPASAGEALKNAEFSISSLAKQLGMPITSGELQAMASTALLTGNDSNQAWLSAQISQHQNYAKVTSLGGLQGGMANETQQLQSLASDYGYQWSPAQIAQNAQSILSGQTTIDTYKQRMMTWAESTFPSLSQQIQGGATVKDLADPYIQSMSNLLEVSPNSLNTYTPMIRKAMQGTVPAGSKPGSAPTSTPLWQFEQQVRQDPRWASTDNAKQTMSTSLLQLGSAFGFGPDSSG